MPSSTDRAIDILDPALYDDPWSTYRWLRDEAPLYRDEPNDLWVVSRHADVFEVSRRSDLWSAAQGVRPKVAADMSLIALDDPEHTRQRRLINRGFTPRRVRELTPHIRELADSIIDEVQERGEIDFVEEMAAHVPLIIISEMMGLDPETRDRMYRWSDAMMAGDGADPGGPELDAAAVAFGEFAEVCMELIPQRREQATDDIIGILTRAFDEGGLEKELKSGDPALYGDGALQDDELLMFLTLLLVAGNETTRNAISGGLLALTRFPDQRQRLLDDPGLMDLAVDEIIRWTTPVMTFMRTCTTAHEVHGQRIEVGDRILMLYQSANRDDRVFERPDDFVVDRSPNNHLAFGAGTHYCLGANLARLEVKVVFEQLLSRLGDIRAAEPGKVHRNRSTLVLGIESLPAVFTPVTDPVAS
ncbi:cytochrome P450 [Iamia majanohamensis]|uniref:Cytochrome P450 n=1 Tax=Iamia majanohamensis TaxID=467976 RepID=A0AAE9YA46_9ACTN|nr:cytochrome P450 [Iamia majanohamensis]WCO67199.1 cytochrome P450 [Iamia majanohamensis]